MARGGCSPVDINICFLRVTHGSGVESGKKNSARSGSAGDGDCRGVRNNIMPPVERLEEREGVRAEHSGSPKYTHTLTYTYIYTYMSHVENQKGVFSVRREPKTRHHRLGHTTIFKYWISACRKNFAHAESSRVDEEPPRPLEIRKRAPSVMSSMPASLISSSPLRSYFFIFFLFSHSCRLTLRSSL